MRIWSLHPCHLDRIGLIACWREALLAQAVLAGRTVGYRNHPQLERFRAQQHPLEAIGRYLEALCEEASERGYSFDGSKIEYALRTIPSGNEGRCGENFGMSTIPVTDQQLTFEWKHLGAKLAGRSPEDAQRWNNSTPTPHPLFRVVPGPRASWERIA